jgi:hypothetical protein
MRYASIWVQIRGRLSATAFRQGFFACGKTALPPLPARATAFRQGFFACGKTALPPLPALGLPNWGRRFTCGAIASVKMVELSVIIRNHANQLSI